jgi:hypothetical protein
MDADPYAVLSDDDTAPDYGLLRACENCGPERFFDFDSETRTL